MSDAAEKEPPPDDVAQAAAEWVLRCDRGLSAAEQDALFQWLAADPRHGPQFARHRQHWQRLERLAQWRPEHSTRPNPDLLAPPLRFRLRRFVPVSLTLAAAAALALVAYVHRPKPAPVPVATAAATVAAPEGQRVLPDGSIVELNRGAVISVNFTAAERRVRLEQGEAYFSVAKDPAHPFIVTARGVDVRAVGTMFNVRLDTAAVEVLVTEGQVQVNPLRESAGAADERRAELPPVPLLEASQRAVVSLGPKAELPQIATLTAREIERVLAWQHRMLTFNAAPLSDVVAEFNRRNVVQLVLLDPELAATPVSANFRSDNLGAFLRFLEMGFGAQCEHRGELEIVLRKAR